MLQILEKKLNNHFRNCQGLDIVEKAVKKIRQTVFRADSTFHEIHNRFHFMMRHKITVKQYYMYHLGLEFLITQMYFTGTKLSIE